MRASTVRNAFVTDERIARAAKVAGEIAEQDLDKSAFDCAATAVNQVFGPWLVDAHGVRRPETSALRLRLIDQVEQRLGLHRRRGHDHPKALAGALRPVAQPGAALQVAAVA